MNTGIKAIETVYLGYRFRSRLEARWAIFFNTLGMKFEYEKEGYDLGKAGWYLPDFWLPFHADWIFKFPNAGVWLEVKGEMPTAEAKNKLLALSQMTKHSGKLVVGMPGEHEIYGTHHSGNHGWTSPDIFPYISDPETVKTRNLWASFGQHFPCGIKIEEIGKAMYAARGARFEHGEGG